MIFKKFKKRIAYLQQTIYNEDINLKKTWKDIKN